VGEKLLPLRHVRLAKLLVGLLLGFVVGVAAQLLQANLLESRIYAGLVSATLMSSGLFVGLFQQPTRRAWLGLLIVFMLSAVLGFGLTGLRASRFAGSALDPRLEG
jgi:competence protein ComEC